MNGPMVAAILKPPSALDFDSSACSLFLAGSIEMGQAEEWQSEVTRQLADLDVVILNPRRDEWDASWEQSIRNPLFVEQVEWELAAQERATIILMHFAPSTRAPITLLELGLFARSGRLIVSCPEGYWRRGNVELVCARYAVPLVESLSALVAAGRKRIELRGGAPPR